MSRKKTGSGPDRQCHFKIAKTETAKLKNLSVTNHLTYKRGCNGGKVKYPFSETGLGHGKEGRGLIFLDKLFQDFICLFRLVINPVNTF